MEAIILAGGLGTRLQSIVSNVPKPMAPVAGRPFLELLLTSLKSKGITRAVLSVGYMSEAITSYFDRHPVGIDLAYQVEPTPLGTGGAIAAALRNVNCDQVFVFNGDTYLDLELSAVAEMWPGDRTPIVVARCVEDTRRFGRMEIVAGRIARFSGPGQRGKGVINAGCYLIHRDIFAGADLPAAFSFEREFLACCPTLSLRAYVTSGKFIDIGIPEDYRRAQTELAAVAAYPFDS
jgi:D-glycero-alpha-D-manno-heptose 1-phosphate guanylyltransferase